MLFLETIFIIDLPKKLGMSPRTFKGKKRKLIAFNQSSPFQVSVIVNC